MGQGTRTVTSNRRVQLSPLVPRPCRSGLGYATSKISPLSAYKSSTEGQVDTTDFRVFLKTADDQKVSPWHDVPLYVEGKGENYCNFYCEIPKETSAKMECATDEKDNPIKQDIKKGKLRFYPYNINWNYGMLPQTWEDPKEKNEECGGIFGDNDPVDVVEIGAVGL